MTTRRLGAGDTDAAAEIIASGGLVAVPTETVYGLGGNGLSPAAIAKIYEVKGRPSVKPVSLLVGGVCSIDKYCENVPGAAYALAEKFWPGPLTLVMNARKSVPDMLLAGGDTVGLRCPSHPLTLEVIEKSGLPLAAPSANISGQKSPKTAGDVLDYFDKTIDAVLDGGTCAIGLESTIIDLSCTPYKILRLGALSEDDIADALVSDMYIIGITGGTGSGKSTALSILGSMGALTLDCDEIYHKLLAESKQLIAEIAESFPSTVSNGVLDRKALGAVVFSSSDALAALNVITHKHVMGEVITQLRNWAMNGGRAAAVDAIALIESGTCKLCSKTVYVTAPESKRIRRIMEREGIGEDYAKARISAQKPDEFFRAHCDYVLTNSGSFEEFEKQCSRLFADIIPDIK